MARRKTENAPAESAETQQEVVETQIDETVEAPAQETETQQETAGSVTMTKIPQFADKILSSYPNYEYLYIDSKGGVYPKGAQHNLVVDAILYQNPYYKQ